jgi:hypothetical protein
VERNYHESLVRYRGRQVRKHVSAERGRQGTPLDGPMASRALLTSLLLLQAACSVEQKGEESRIAADAAPGSTSLPAAVIASPTAAPTTALPPPLDREARAVCAGVAAAWRTVARATVRELDTLLAHGDVIEDRELDTLPPASGDPARWAACAVEGFAEAGLDSIQQRTLYWPAAGWVVLPRLHADGPGGQVQVYQRGWVRCQVAGEWDPGDDGDSAYVPVPFHREWTFCWRHPRLVRHADTVNRGG